MAMTKKEMAEKLKAARKVADLIMESFGDPDDAAPGNGAPGNLSDAIASADPEHDREEVDELLSTLSGVHGDFDMFLDELSDAIDALESGEEEGGEDE